MADDRDLGIIVLELNSTQIRFLRWLAADNSLCHECARELAKMGLVEGDPKRPRNRNGEPVWYRITSRGHRALALLEGMRNIQ